MRILTVFLALCLLAVPAHAAQRPKVAMPAARPLTFEAVAHAASRYGVPLAPLLGILATENGRLGEALGNTNGTWDLGPFQINSCHLNDLAKIGFTPVAIMSDGPANAQAAAWLLKREIHRAGNLWQGVGHYHSRTPFRKYGYIRKVRANVELLRRKGVTSLPIQWGKKL